MARLRVPRTPQEFTADWMTQALRDGGVIRDARVTAVEPSSLGAGVGFLGQVGRVKLTYDRAEPGAPASVIAKMPTLDPGGREICRIFQFYEREIRFYNEVAGSISLRVPRCYHTAMDAEADDYLIVLEDMTDVQVGDEVAGCSVADAERSIAAIAAMQAPWWDNPKIEAIEWMPYINSPVQQSAEQSYNEALPHYVDSFGDLVSPKMLRIADDMKSHIIELLELMARPPRTLVHGDYRLDNIFFGEGGKIAAIDWQISSRGRGIFDLAYFLSSALSPAERKANEMRLLKVWHAIVTGDGSHPNAYTFDDALEDYRRAILFCNVYTVIGIGTLDPANERGMTLFRAWIERRNAAIEDLDAGEMIPR